MRGRQRKSSVAFRSIRWRRRSSPPSRPPMAEPWPDFTPVALLTGFLGSGKTTLLKRMLADPALSDTAVIINEFGEVGLDHHLIEHVADDVVLLPSGCLCCAMKGELARACRDR